MRRLDTWVRRLLAHSAAVAILVVPSVVAADSPDDAERAHILIEGDLSVTTDEQRTVLTVASMAHDFVVQLPYTDRWDFDSNEGTPLTGRSDRYTVALTRRRGGEAEPRELLEQALDDLLIEGADVCFLQFTERNDRDVLGFQVRHSENGPWHWFYWVLVPAGESRLQLNVVDRTPAELEPFDIELAEAMSRATTVSAVLGTSTSDGSTGSE